MHRLLKLMTSLSFKRIQSKPAILFTLVFISSSFLLFAQVKPTSADDRLKGLKQRQVLDQRSTVNHIKFRNIGPTVMSGRVADIDANPEDPTEFYVAYASGGVWHTINNGLKRQPMRCFHQLDVTGFSQYGVIPEDPYIARFFHCPCFYKHQFRHRRIGCCLLHRFLPKLFWSSN